MERAVFAAGDITPENASTRSARAEARKARREWIVRTGAAPAELPMWTSRDGWCTDLASWLATDEGLTVCARLPIRPDLVLHVAGHKAAHADHATGRNCAVANATVAKAAGCSARTVTNVNKVLSASGLAIEAHRGTGSASTPGFGRRPSIWHLISRPQPAAGPAVCDLPPSRRDRRLALDRSKSPSARERARRPKSNPPPTSPKRGRRCAPRPLHVQLLAAGILHSNPIGLDQGHIGRICDALTDSGLDLQAWSAKALLAALNADMKTRGWDWPNQVQNPRAFLASRLRLLPVRPAGAPEGGVTAALQEARTATAVLEPVSETRASAQARMQRWNADVTAVTTEAQRAMLLRAHTAKFGSVADPVTAIGAAGRRASRLYPELPLIDALTQWATDVLGDDPESAPAQPVPAVTSLSTDLLMDLAIGNCDCVVCGSQRATERPQLPLKSMVCDQCWPVIAAELDEASDYEGMLA